MLASYDYNITKIKNEIKEKYYKYIKLILLIKKIENKKKFDLI